MTEAADAKKTQGNDAFKKGDYDEAVKLYSEAIDMDPSNHLYYSNRAAAYLAQGKNDLAREDCDKCLAIDSSFVKAYLRKATALFNMEQLQDALSVVSQGIKVCPDGGKKQKKSSGLADLKKLLQKIKAKLNPKGEGDSKRAMSQAMLSRGNIEEIRDLEAKYEAANIQLANLRQDIQRKVYQIQRNEKCMSVLGDLGDGSTLNAYKQVGRVFIKRDFEKIIEDYKTDNSALETEVEGLNKGFTHTQRTLKEAQENLKELTNRKN